MEWLKTTLIVIQLVSSVLLIAVVLIQPSKSQGLSSTITGGDVETFFGSKNGGGTYEGFMKRVTAVGAGIFLITSLVLSFFFL